MPAHGEHRALALDRRQDRLAPEMPAPGRAVAVADHHVRVLRHLYESVGAATVPVHVAERE